MKLLSFDSQNLVVDWVSLNIQGFTDAQTIDSNLSKHFTPHILFRELSLTLNTILRYFNIRVNS